MTLLELTTENSADGSVRIALSGELDISSAPKVEAELDRVQAASPTLVMLDLRDLRFMDSTGLRTVVGADKRARERGGRLAIVRGPESVQRIFSVTRLDERLEIVDDPAAAQA